MKKITTLFLLVLLAQSSCDIIVKDCPECFTPPPTFGFEFIDKDTGENLFTNETLKIEDIEVFDENKDEIEFQLITENNINVLDLSYIGWTEGPKYYTIKLSADISVPITLNMKEKNTKCCTYFEVIEFSVLEYDYEKSNDLGYIIVKL